MSSTKLPAEADAAFGIWDASRPEDYDAWLRLWRSSAAPLIFAHPGFARLFVVPDQVQARCAYLISSVGCIMYVFLLRDLRVEPCWSEAVGPASDIITPYGYGGPLAWGGELAKLAGAFTARFDRWLSANNVVSEFIRRCVFFEMAPGYPVDWEPRQPNVVRWLELSEDELWNDYDSKVRRNVRRARESGVTVAADTTAEHADEFRRIYYSTMDRRGAGQSYYFSEEFFAGIHADLAGHYVYFHGGLDGRIVTSDLVLFGGDTAYFFLGGSDARYFAARPNDLVKHEMIRWCKRQGIRRLQLGGGLTSEPSDSLYRYKKSFAPRGEQSFYVGSRILDADRYRMLTERHLAQSPDRPAHPTYFPAYRQPS